MTGACLDHGLPPPLFEEIGTHFRVTLFALRKPASEVDKRDRLILDRLESQGKAGLTTAESARRIGLSPRAARTRLASLVERGKVVEIGSGPQDPRRRYYLTPGE